jgi:hypothetical protein
MLLFFFISGTFTTAFTPVLASELVENSWNIKKSMSQARRDFGVIAIDGKIYAIGGEAENLGFLDTNEQYDPVRDTWVTLKPMPTPRAGFAIVAYGGKIYCIGGYSMQFEPVSPIVLSVNEVYDPITNSWSTKTAMPFSDSAVLEAHIINEKIFVLDQYGNLFMYDPIKDSWTQKTSILHPEDMIEDTRVFTFSIVLDNKMFVLLLYVNDFSWKCKGKIMLYDTKTDTWSEGNAPSDINDINSFVPSRGIGSAEMTTGSYAPQKIYFFSKTNEILTYTPTDDTWSTVKGTTKERNLFGVAIVDDIFYLIGGHYPFSSSCSINEQYIPIGYSATSPTFDPSTNRPFSTESIIVIIILTTSIVIMTSLFLYLRGRKTTRGIKYE